MASSMKLCHRWKRGLKAKKEAKNRKKQTKQFTTQPSPLALSPFFLSSFFTPYPNTDVHYSYSRLPQHPREHRAHALLHQPTRIPH